MLTVLDVENSITVKEKKDDITPYHPNNSLVSVGWCNIKYADGEIYNESYVFFKHDELPTDYDTNTARIRLQYVLDSTTLLIGHNIKHDLSWLLESGFKYEGKIYDTKIAEYVIQRGHKWATDLDNVARRRKVYRKKGDLVEDYIKQGIGFEAIPINIVEEYGQADVRSTAEIYLDQVEDYKTEYNSGLVKTRDMMFDMCIVLTDMERNGICIDREELTRVKVEYQNEKKQLEYDLNKLVYEVMGDTPINLASPEQLSMVVYSRKVRDKHEWARIFNIGVDNAGKALRRPRMKKNEFMTIVRNNMDKVYKQKAKQCPECKGTGKYDKFKKDGSPHKKQYQCKACSATGLIYENLQQYAGLKLSPAGVLDASSGGFSTDRDTLTRLMPQAKVSNNQLAISFLEKVIRLNAVDTYLSSFVGGIERGVQDDKILHARFNQTVARTGRLSSSDPNFHNQPRGNTFPVRRAVVSRFKDGKIMEGDYAQLEFRCAGILANCPDIRRDISNGVDAHQYTADILTQHGQSTNRQEAKSHTFKPLYGGTSGTPAEQEYYKDFLENRYPRVGEWHKELLEEAIQYKRITIPTGREYAFDAERTHWGGCTFATQIKNYPVQGFATADIVPIANILYRKLLLENRVKSLHINTVHDSLTTDVYPGEETIVRDLKIKAMLGVVDALYSIYNITLSIPLEVEVKMGPNWLDQKVIAKIDTNGKREYYDTVL